MVVVPTSCHRSQGNRLTNVTSQGPSSTRTRAYGSPFRFSRFDLEKQVTLLNNEIASLKKLVARRKRYCSIQCRKIERFRCEGERDDARPHRSNVTLEHSKSSRIDA